MNALDRRDFLKAVGAGAGALAMPDLAHSRAAGSQPAARPNIIVILTDDQGYGDFACHGNQKIKTPNLDRLHGQSVRFTDFHVSPTCSPTRCSLMTGRHEFKSGVTHTINERERMSPKATTLAQVLKSAGYTTGIFGKWHLGDEPDHWPSKRGFDEMFIHGAGGIGQSYPGSCGDAPGNRYFDPAILHNGTFEKTTGYCTDVFFTQAIKWIESRKGKAPFFAYITPNAPHAPLNCPEEYLKKYEGQGLEPNQAAFFGMITNIDDNVGRLLAKLKDWGIERDTLVIFMNDNGGTAGVKVFNAGMRGQKGTPYNGGTRAASFWRWPDTLKPADVDKLTAHIDILPTLAELTGAKVPDEVAAKLDGRSLMPLLRDPGAAWPDRYLFTHVGRWAKGKAAESKYASCSIRSPRYNMVRAGKGGGKWELYDLKDDPGETKDVSAEHPDVVKAMSAAYDKWWEEVLPCLENEDAVGPAENPFRELYRKQFGGGAQGITGGEKA
jgi:arylsulfatase